jgi:hypothetical protein
VRYRITLMFELTSLGAILPSYDVETRILNDGAASDMMLYAQISLVVLRKTIMKKVRSVRAVRSTVDMSDILGTSCDENFILFGLCYRQVLRLVHAVRHPTCDAYLCAQIGYHDDWQTMGETRALKQFLSLCVCIQLFKVIKFTSQLIPKMSLMTSVLRTCAVDLLFFGVVFFNSVIAFSTMLYISYLLPLTSCQSPLTSYL